MHETTAGASRPQEPTYRDCYRVSPTGPRATPWVSREVSVLLLAGDWHVLACLGSLADQRVATDIIVKHRKACGFISPMRPRATQ